MLSDFPGLRRFPSNANRTDSASVESRKKLERFSPSVNREPLEPGCSRGGFGAFSEIGLRDAPDHSCDLGGNTIGAQLRRPDKKQSCSFRFSTSLVLNQTPPAIKSAAIRSVSRFIVM